MIRLAARVLLLGWVVYLAPAFAQTVQPRCSAEAREPYLLTVRYRGEHFGDLVPSFMAPAGALSTPGAPPGAVDLFLFEGILSALGIWFERSADGGIAGRLQTGEEPFAFGATGAFDIGRLTGQLAAGDFCFRDKELYLSADAIAKALPLRIVADASSQTLRVQATAPMPVDLIRQREVDRARLMSKDNSRPPALAEFPYRALGRPSGDVRLNHSRSDALGIGQIHYDGLVSTELAYATTQLYFTGNASQGMTDVRLQFGRESPLGDVFGLPGVTRAYAGDVNGPAAALAGGGSLRGVAVSAYPLSRSDSFDRTTLQGDALPGTDVELYRGSQLLAFTQADADGRYQFANVPLLFGDNKLRLVFYGAGGLIKEEVQDFSIGSGMTPTATVYWRMLAGHPGKRLLGALLPTPGQAVAAQAANLSVEADIGITQWLSVNAFAARAPEAQALGSLLRDTLGTGLRVSTPLGYFSGDVARQVSPALPGRAGRAWRVAGLTSMGGLSLSGRFAGFDNFLSQVASRSASALKAERSISARATLPIRDFPVGLALISERWGYADGATEQLERAQINFSVARVFVSQDLELRRFRYPGVPESSTLGWVPKASVNLNNDFRLAATARYDVNRASLDQLLLSANLRWDPKNTVSLGISQSNPVAGGQHNNKRYNAFASLSRDFGSFAGSVNVATQSDGSYFVGLGVNLSFGFDRHGRAHFASANMAQQGLADVFVFHDVNDDGRFDKASDLALPSALVTVNGHGRSGMLSTSSGSAVLKNLSTNAPVTLDVEPASIDDPFLVAARGGVRFLPRAGRVFDTNIALVDTGSIAGTLRDVRDGKSVVIAGVVIDLVDLVRGGDQAQRQAHVGFSLKTAQGRPLDSDGFSVVQTVRSQFDGHYLFDLVPPGDYLVRARPGQNLRGVALVTQERPVTLSLHRLSPQGIDLLLMPPSAAPSPSNSAAD